MNLEEKTFERHSNPENRRYKSIRIAEPGNRIASTVIPGLTIEVGQFLGDG